MIPPEMVELLEKLHINLDLTGVQGAVLASSVAAVSAIKKAAGTFWKKQVPGKAKPWILLGVSALLTYVGLQSQNAVTVDSMILLTLLTTVSGIGWHQLQKMAREKQESDDDPRAGDPRRR